MSDQEIVASVAEDLRKDALELARPGKTDQGVSDCRRRIIELQALHRPKSMVHPALLHPRS